MELVGEAAGRGLAYLIMVENEGGELNRLDLDNFVQRAGSAGVAPHGFMSQFAIQGLGGYAESPSDMFRALSWAYSDGLNIRPTQLGRTVARGLSRTVSEVADEPATVIIDPESPLAYARVLSVIDEHDEALVVDPYLEPREFYQLFESLSVARILTGSRKKLARDTGVRHALAARADSLELRTIDQDELHDRYVIGEDAVTLLGSSLNSIAKRPGVIVPLSDAIASRSMRAAYEELWARADRAEPLEGPTPAPAASDGTDAS